MFAPATRPSPFHAFDNLGHWFHRITMVLAGAWEAQRVYSRLSGLSPSQLAARGMTRDDVNRAVLRALDGQQQ